MPAGLRLRVATEGAAAAEALAGKQICLFLGGQGEMRCLRQDVVNAPCLEQPLHARLPEGVRVVLPEIELEIFFCLLPWHVGCDPRRFRETHLYHFAFVPFCGWWNHVWHDGILFHMVQGNEACSSVCPEGGGAILCVPDKVRQFDVGERPPLPETGFLELNFRSSLVAALTEAFDLADRHVALALRWPTEPSLATALGTIALRMVLPDAHFHLLDPPTHLAAWCYWRRFCQNMGIDFARAHRGLAPARVFELECCERLFPDERRVSYAKRFNHLSPVIPLELIGVDQTI